ncbi:MAG: PAS domain S-box protein [Tychonema bourrellyi B0820]|uniref:histidine kinase n=1 Tax=Tychonema bourrellyi FEM_GT703 TaxID=2040638 RepID=A0A2G4EWH1_9CYAN|nr:PAS domain S-box protein [Tychonema bourrellyi]MDQ2098611.1 PAS domain S-box protein [Tychonema bourrellyi B0820]PHX53869.1 histidine kinase [Tychonema bourrellyi FEM_GT703]
MQEVVNWYQSFLSNSVDAFLECDRQQKYLYVNSIAAEWMGLEPSEIVHRTNQDLLKLYPNNPALKNIISQIDSCLQQVLLTGERRLAIHEVIEVDGGIKIYETAYTPVVDVSSNQMRVFGVGRDITRHYRWQQQKTQQLRRSNHLLWLNAANTPLAMLGWDENFRIIQWSKRAEEIFGWTSDDMMGKRFDDLALVCPEDREAVSAIELELATGKGNTSINRNYTKSGTVIWCRWFNSIIRSGDTFTVLSLVEDITDRKILEAAKAQGTRLTAMVADVGIALTKYPQDILMPCCEAIVKNLDVVSAEIWTFNSQEKALEMQAVAERSSRQDNIAHFVQTKINEIAQSQKPQTDCIFQLNNVNIFTQNLGENIVGNSWELAVSENPNIGVNCSVQKPIVSFSGYPLIVEERLVGVMGIVSTQPMTEAFQETISSVADVIALGIERKRAEAELKSARAFLTSVVENLPVGVFAKDASSLKFVLWNKAGETIAGVTSQEAIGKNDYDIYSKEQADVSTAQDREFLTRYQNQSRLTEILEEPFQTRHKGMRILHTRKVPILDSKGNPQYVLGITEDITERRQVDESVRLYDQIVENMQIGLYVYHLENMDDDSTLRAIASNPAATKFTGLEMADVLGMTIDEIFPKSRSKNIPQVFSSVIRNQKAVELEDIDCDESGRITRTLSIKAFPLPNNCIGVAFENITDRKCLELDLKLALEQTERSEQLLRTVIDKSSDWIFAKDQDFRCILANNSFAQALGKRVEEIIGKSDLELMIYEDIIVENATENILKLRTDDLAVLAGGIIHNPCDSAVFADGSIHIFDTQKVPLRDTEGHIFAVLSFAHDITERHKYEAALRRSEARFRSLVANIPGVVYRWQCDFSPTFISDAVYSLTGYPAADFRLLSNRGGRSFASVIYSEDLAQVEATIRQGIENKQSYSLEYRLVAADGTIKWVWDKGSPVFDEDGKVDCLDGVIFDISDRYHAQEALQQKTSELEAVFRTLPDLYFRLNADGVILDYLSGDSSDIYMATEDFLGKRMLDIFPANIASKFEKAIFQALEKNTSVTLEYSIEISNKKETYEARLLPFNASQIIIISRNITLRKQAESKLKEKNYELKQALKQLGRTQSQLIQSEKMSGLGQLVAGIAHEINNPISFIYGNVAYASEYAENLLKLCCVYQEHYPEPVSVIADLAEEIEIEFMKEDFPHLLNSIKIGAERIRQIVLSLRNFSRLEESDIKRVDIHEGIDSALLILEHRIKENGRIRNIEIVKEYGELPPVQCYVGQLNQVFMNILSNAIDALGTVRNRKPEPGTSETEREDSSGLSVSCNASHWILIRTEVLENNRIAIAISDNGPGMEESVKSRIFDPFFTTKPVGKGTGLGLSISYQIVVERHGGTLRCVSTPGRGTEFAIEIPIRQR